MKTKDVLNRIIRKEKNNYFTFSKYFGFGIFGIILLLVLFNGCNSDIDKIRNATPEGITSVTIGDLLEKSPVFESYQWRSFSTDIGETIVEFNAEINADMPNFLSKIYKRSEFVIQFILNKDGEGYKDGYCGYNLVLIDNAINNKMKFVEIYEHDIYYNKSEIIINPINLDTAFKLFKDQNNIFSSLYNKEDIFSSGEEDYETYIKRIINDKLLYIIDNNDWAEFKDFETVFGKLSDYFKKLSLYDEDPRPLYAHSYDNVLNYFFKSFIVLVDTVSIQEKEKFVSSFDKLVSLGFNMISNKDNLICKMYSTNNLVEKDKYLDELYKSSGRYTMDYLDFDRFREEYANKSVPPSLQEKFKNTLAKCEVIKE